MGDDEKAGLAATAVSSEMEDGVGRKDAGVLRDGKTSFSDNKCMRGAVGPALLPFGSLFTSSFARLGRKLVEAAVFCTNAANRTGGGLLQAADPMSPSSMFLFSPSSAHSSAASKYAGENDGLVCRAPLLVSPTCSDRSTFTARLPATFLPRWPGFLGTAGRVRPVLVAVVDMAGVSAPTVTSSGRRGP
jgi:hypothetical protein